MSAKRCKSQTPDSAEWVEIPGYRFRYQINREAVVRKELESGEWYVLKPYISGRTRACVKMRTEDTRRRAAELLRRARMNTNKLRPCKVGEELYLFHGFTQISQIVPPSLMRGGHGGGVVAGAYAVLERRDGTVGLAEAQRVQFLDTAKEFAKYEEEETKDV